MQMQCNRQGFAHAPGQTPRLDIRAAEGVSGQRAAPLQGGVGITSTYLAPFSTLGFNNPTLIHFP
jgi:hypothetical protein